MRGTTEIGGIGRTFAWLEPHAERGHRQLAVPPSREKHLMRDQSGFMFV
jgi:hypothetical protein